VSKNIEPKYVVLAAVDMREGSPLVISQALEIASHHPRGELHVLSVSEPTPAVVMPPVMPAADAIVAPRPERLADLVRSHLDDFKKRHPESRTPPIEVHTSLGYASDEIVWLAAHVEADLVVVATHGRRGLARLLLGSVSEKVARLAGCPVMVVRDKHHQAENKVPEIEPICQDCAWTRATSNGAKLWCERHSVHHARAHVYHADDRGVSAPPASQSMTGTG
jgi:nucleotide-binding universal stress UspA family protein